MMFHWIPFLILILFWNIGIIFPAIIIKECEDSDDCGTGSYCDRNDSKAICKCINGYTSVIFPSIQKSSILDPIKEPIIRSSTHGQLYTLTKHSNNVDEISHLKRCLPIKGIGESCISSFQCRPEKLVCITERCICPLNRNNKHKYDCLHSLRIESRSYNQPTTVIPLILNNYQKNNHKFSNHQVTKDNPLLRHGGLGAAMTGMVCMTLVLLGCGLTLVLAGLIKAIRTGRRRRAAGGAQQDNDSVFRDSISHTVIPRVPGRRGDSRPPSYGSVPPPTYEESAAREMSSSQDILTSIEEVNITTDELPNSTTMTVSASAPPGDHNNSNPDPELVDESLIPSKDSNINTKRRLSLPRNKSSN